jgi:hypothetical protein
MIERDEDTFAALRAMAEDIHLVSRNYNDELIGIEYYNKLELLSNDELTELLQLWQLKSRTCHKEKLASQWMVVQVMLLIAVANYLAWLSGGIPGTLFSILGVIAAIAMIEDSRVRRSKQNLADARRVYQHLLDHQQARA